MISGSTLSNKGIEVNNVAIGTYYYTATIGQKTKRGKLIVMP
jgi:hypothetical protein